MGIPKFAAWLTRKYPDIVMKTCPPRVHGLYIDMNGIIHPCCHSEEDPSVSRRSEAEKIESVCLCVKQLVEATKPTTVLYLAMDGVAPRAKMNQQRARRYMSAVDQYGQTFAPQEHGFSKEERTIVSKELAEARKSIDVGMYGHSTSLTALDEAEVQATSAPASGMGSPQKSQEGIAHLFPDVAELIQDFKTAQPMVKGKTASHHPSTLASEIKGEEEEEAHFDSNCISPGTEFMTNLSERVKRFVSDMIHSSDPLWSSLAVVYSDTNTPGEGEHKLIDFIRVQASYAEDATSLFHPQRYAAAAPLQQQQQQNSGGGSHVICGLDADLILLCLSLHLDNVVIMRDVKRKAPAVGKGKKPLRGTSAVDGPHDDDNEPASPASSPGLKNEDGSTAAHFPDPSTTEVAAPAAATPSTPSTPKPSYEYFDVDAIGNSIVSELHNILKVQMPNWRVASVEGFQNILSSTGYHLHPRHSPIPSSAVAGWLPTNTALNFKLIDDFVALATLMGNDFVPRIPSAFCGESAMDNFLEVYLRCVLPYGFLTVQLGDINLRQLGRFLEGYAQVETMLYRRHMVMSSQWTPNKAVGALGSEQDEDWRLAYYKTTTCKKESLDDACRAYLEGIRFVWRYYSCTSEYCSWSWFYPFHHAPFALDLARFLERHQWRSASIPPPPVEKEAPPIFVQLLCILPPTSCKLLPSCFADTMKFPTTDALRATFPSSWAVDYAGSNNKEHLATVLLPFAHLDVLMDVVSQHEKSFSETERKRSRHCDGHLVFMRDSSIIGLRGQEKANSDGEASGLKDIAPSSLFRPRTYASSTPVRNLSMTFKQSRNSGKRGRKETSNSSNGGKGASGADSSSTSSGKGLLLCGDLIFAGASCSLLLFLIVTSTTTLGYLLPSMILHMSTIALVSLWLLTVLGIGLNRFSSSTVGCGLKRNNTRDGFVDWLCGHCLSLNFMRNERCFQCQAPCDEQASWAIFTGKLPQQPPPFEADHSAHIVWAELPPAEVKKKQLIAKHSDDEHPVPEVDEGNVGML